MTIVTILHWVSPKLQIANHWSKNSSGRVGWLGDWVVEIRIKAQVSSAKLATGTELGNNSTLEEHLHLSQQLIFWIRHLLSCNMLIMH